MCTGYPWSNTDARCVSETRTLAVFKTGTVFVLLAALAACARTNRWVEEVQLSDGTVVSVMRAMEYTPPTGGMDQPRDSRLALQERLVISNPDGEHEAPWSASHRVAAYVDRIDGRVWIVGQLTTVCERGFTGEPVWVAYVLQGTDWVRVEAAAAPQIARPNLLLDSTTYRITEGLSEVNLETKKELDARSGVGAAVRSIDLRLVPNC